MSAHLYFTFESKQLNMNAHVSRLLIQRLEKSDGRPLYKYKIGDDTYKLLKQYLTETPHSNQNLLFWSGMFTLYAVEWWRREYDGGHWEWHPIFKSLDKEYLDNAQLRQSLIDKGFHYWQREITVNSNGNKTYLGSIYAECGIPNYALCDKHYLSYIITQCFKRLNLIYLSDQDSLFIVREVAESYLPESLQGDVSYKLLKEITEELIFLKNKYNLGEKDNPCTYLDDHIPTWRENFPIQMSDIGNSFIDSLLSEVHKIESIAPHQIQVEHKLLNNHDACKIISQINFPNKTLAFQSLGMDTNTFNRFSNKAKVILHNEKGIRMTLGFAFKNQDKGFRLSIADNTNLSDYAWQENWQLVLLDTFNDEEYLIEVPNTEALGDDSPWIFAQKNSSLILKAEGSSNITNTEAYIVFPEHGEIKGSHMCCGNLLNRKIARIQEDCYVVIDNNLYKISLRAKIEENFYFKLVGNSLPYGTIKDVFIEIPKVQKVDKTSLLKLFPNGRIEIQRNSSEGWIIPSKSYFGRMKIRFIGNEGEVIFIKQVNILPRGFSIDLNNNGNSTGQISIKGSESFSINLLSKDAIDGQITKTNTGHNLILKNLDQVKVEEAEIELVPENSGSVKLPVPIPKEKFNIYNSEGDVLSKNSLIHVDELLGYRISIFNNRSTPKNSTIRLELFDNRDLSIQMGINRRIIIPGYSQKKKPLIDYLDDIQRLLAFGSLDAFVRFSFDSFYISIRNYSLNRFIGEEDSFNIKNLMNKELLVQPQTFRVDQDITEGSFHNLIYNDVEDNWKMPYNYDGNGNWLIFPGSHSKKQFRPLLLPKEDPVEGLEFVENMNMAGRIKEQKKRISLLSSHFSKIATDFNHPSWNELKILWDKTNHLPCKTFDAWSALIESNSGLVTAFILLNEGLIHKLTEEYSINWLLLPVKVWLEIFHAYHSLLESSLRDSTIVNQIIGLLVDRLKTELNLCFVGELIEYQVLDQNPPQGLMLNEFILKSIIKDDILGQQNRTGLIGRHRMQDEWPVALQRDIVRMSHNLPSIVTSLFPQDLLSYTKAVIYLPALVAVQSVSQNVNGLANLDSLVRFRLNEVLEFDHEWHYNLYNYVQGFYWKSLSN